jgi:hypothetical protein
LLAGSWAAVGEGNHRQAAKKTTLTVTLYRTPALISIKPQSGAAISGEIAEASGVFRK